MVFYKSFKHTFHSYQHTAWHMAGIEHLLNENKMTVWALQAVLNQITLDMAPLKLMAVEYFSFVSYCTSSP